MKKSACLSVLVCILTILYYSEVNGGVIMAGSDCVTSVATHTLQIFGPGGFTETINLSSGGFNINRLQAQGLGDGTPASFINTEIKGLTLTGTSINVGSLTTRIGADNGVQEGATLGQIQNVLTLTPGSPTLVAPTDFVSGNSFFDVFFEIDVAGMTFYNKSIDPLNMSSFITSIPPIGAVHTSSGFVSLFQRVGAINNNADPLVGALLVGSHTLSVTPCPEPASFALLGVGFMAAGVVSRRRLRRQLAVPSDTSAATSGGC